MKKTNRTEAIFTFGSNIQGIHGAGAAAFAYENHGAVWGIGKGLRGNSYAIPTRKVVGSKKELVFQTLPLSEIESSVKDFLSFARNHPDLLFNVTSLGTGYAGYKHKQIASMFKRVPFNINLPIEWKEFFPEHQYFIDWNTK